MSGRKTDPNPAAWEAFMHQGQELPSLSPRILKSWKRCRAYLNPLQKINPNRLSEQYLLASQVSSFDLISVAHPVMEEIYENIEHRGVSVILVNSAGYVLDNLCDDAGQELLHSLGIANGVCLTENQLGTNAFGLALIERSPAYVVGGEHYLQDLHHIADVAAPAFDWNGAPLGALGILTPLDTYHRHNYALAVLAARSIKSQRQSDLVLNQMRADSDGLRSVLAGLHEAVLIWNAQRNLSYANPAAERLFGRSDSAWLGAAFQEVANWPRSLRRSVERKEELVKAQVTIKLGERFIPCTATLQFISRQREVEWMVLILQPGGEEARETFPVKPGKPASRSIDLVVESPAMRRVWRQVTQAAAAKASVLVQGEPGVGKSALIQALYEAGPQRDGPFVIFPCSTIPDNLMLEELLGFDEGVSSKRLDGKPSKFEQAAGGALYFQDIEHLTLPAQGALLNYLNYNLIQRLGGDRPVHVETRILASSAAHLERLVAEKRFRAELFYRLSSFKIVVPALRDRQPDLPVLVERYLEKLSTENKRAYRLAPGVMEVLLQYPWPGNIRELEAVLESASNQVSASGIIRLAHLPERLRSPEAFFQDGEDGFDLRPLPELEEAALVQAARMYQGNMTRMAEALQIGRTTVWRKLKKFSISLEDFREAPHLVDEPDGEV